jgi:hypothetical protein
MALVFQPVYIPPAAVLINDILNCSFHAPAFCFFLNIVLPYTGQGKIDLFSGIYHEILFVK